MGLRSKFESWLGSANGNATATAAPDFEERGVDATRFVGPVGMLSRPVAAPETSAQRKQEVGLKVDESVRGLPGTPNLAGFIEDIGEYDPKLQGLSGIKIYEKMRRSDPICAALELARTLPIRAADWQIVEGVDESQPGRGLAKEMAALARENFFGGLERTTASGEKKTQTFESVIENALLCAPMGCGAHEDIWEVDADKGNVRLARMAPRLPDTFYQFVTEPDGETLYELIQFGFRGPEVLLLPVKATKLSFFTINREGANFYGRSIFRPCYLSWFFKQHLMRIESVALERNGLGVPHINMGPNASPDDKAAAWQYVANVSANERSGMVTPNLFTFDLVGIKGKVLSPRAAIEYYDRQMLNSGLAGWLLLGQGSGGSRAVGGVQKDFYLLAEEALAGMIAETITSTSLRRLCDHNFESKPGERLPYPKLICSDIRMVELETVLSAVKDLAAANVGVLETTSERDNAVAEMLGLPKVGATTRPKFAPIVRQIREMEQAATQGIPDEDAPKTSAQSTPRGGEKRDEVEVKNPGNKKEAKSGVTQEEELSELQLGEQKSRPLWQPKNDFEKHVNQAALRNQEDKTQRVVARLMRRAKPALAEQAARQAAHTPVASLGHVAVPFDDALAAQIEHALDRAFDMGDQSVERELKAQKSQSQALAEKKNRLPVGGKKGGAVKKRLLNAKLIAQTTVTDLSNWINSRAAAAAVDLSKDGLSGDDLDQGISHALNSASDGFVDRGAAEAARQAVAGGRMRAFDRHSDELQRIVRREVMDGNTCEPCQAGDGREWDSWDEVDWHPGDDCEGGDACRGDLVAELGTGIEAA